MTQTRTNFRMPQFFVATAAEAVRFIDAVGFCLLFPVKGIALPSLYQAVARLRPGQAAKWDKYAELIWGWKDDLPRRGRAFYAKYFKSRGTFISVKLLAHFLSMRGSPTAATQHDEFYAQGKISPDALILWKALAEHGALPTLELRHACKMESKSGNARYKKAMLELQGLLAVVHFGAEQETAAWPSSRFELTARAFPNQAAAARKIAPADARRVLAEKYLQRHPRATRHDLQRLFGWRGDETPPLMP